jgi:hypothetical protein
MARAKSQSNGKLDEAMTALAHAQATLVQTQASFLAQMADLGRESAETRRRSDEDAAEMRRRADERFAKIDEWQRRADERFARIEAILLDHSRILHALPDAIRDKIGFKAP